MENELDESLIEDINEFTDEMVKIIEEKLPKYKDTWKTCNIKILKAKMIQQIGRLSFSISDIVLPKELQEKVDKTHNDNAMRALLHIAIYAFFLRKRLGK